ERPHHRAERGAVVGEGHPQRPRPRLGELAVHQLTSTASAVAHARRRHRSRGRQGAARGACGFTDPGASEYAHALSVRRPSRRHRRGGAMILQAEKRTPGSSAALRRAGRLPAVVYNRETNELLSVDARAFDKAFRAQGTSSLITLELDGKPTSVLVKQVQMDKRRREPMHVDFYAITEGQVVDVHVPIELVGTPAGVREGGQLDVQRREVHISILPRLIPNHVELDISGLAIGDSLHVSDVLSVLPTEARI